MTGVAHIGFIVAAYGATALALVGAIIALVVDRRAQKRALAQLNSRDTG